MNPLRGPTSHALGWPLPGLPAVILEQPMVLSAVLPGFVIGASLGLLGGGGSILTVPIFVYVLGFGPRDAIAMSLAVVGVTSAVGVLGHLRRGNVDLRTALVFGAAGMVGTFAGTRVSAFVSGPLQLAIFGTAMIAAAGFMLLDRAEMAGENSQRTGAAMLVLIIIEALAVGLLTGLVGVGGGFLIVPALVMLKVPVRTAVGTSLAVIVMNCAVGFYGYIDQANFAWEAMALVTAGTLPGIWAGTYFHHRVSQERLRRGFAVFLLVVAAFILYENLPTVLASETRRSRTDLPDRAVHVSPA
jgi:uncharacterized protein